jgi:hypothetical protein
MKKADPDELRPEYSRQDLRTGVRGKYFEAFRSGTNLVLLQPDVAKAFPNDESVNEALRSLMDASEGSLETTKTPS